MAQADLLVELVKSASDGDQIAFRKISEALIQEERNKGHRILADRLIKALRPNGSINPHTLKKNEHNNTHKNFIFEAKPERDLDSLVLTQKKPTINLKKSLKNNIDQSYYIHITCLQEIVCCLQALPATGKPL